MSHAAIMIAGYDPGYLRIAEFHVRRELAQGRIPVVVDATALSGGGVDSYDRATLRRFGLPFPGHDLTERMLALGVAVVDLATLIDDTADEPLGAELEETLAIAVQSALITYFRTDQPDRSKRRVKATNRALTNEGRSVYRGFAALFAGDPEIDLAYVPNGRFPQQKMAQLAARDAGLAMLHFEKGETENGSYLQDHAPQNRLATQAAAEPLLADLSVAEVDEIAETWLARRAPSPDSRNEFSALWSSDLPETLRPLAAGDGPVAGFFTSSQDEFQFLGPEWQLHEWKDQFEAFDATMTRLEEAGYRCYLRVHPNLATKAQDCFVRERAGIRWLARRHPGLIVVWHDAFASTYALLDLTDVAVVWDSTVGLEASARGLPVFTMATSRYGLVADVREILSAEQLDRDGVAAWPVDAHAAKRFIAYLLLRDAQMSPDFDGWLPWAAQSPPFGAKVAAVLAAGGIPYPSEAVKAQLDVYRHRSIQSNLRHLRG